MSRGRGFGLDVRYALRQIARSPAMSALVVMTLAVGVGANTALYSMANAIFTRPLPGIRGAERLVWVTPRDARHGGARALAYPDVEDYRTLTGEFDGVAAFSNLRLAVNAQGEPEQVRGQVVSANFFSVLGTRMMLGRGFVAEEDRAIDGAPVVVLSHQYWSERLGADSSVLGKRIVVNGAPFAIIGVTEARFNGPAHAERLSMWLPISMVNRAWPLNHNALRSRGTWWLEAIARLKPGVSVRQASSAAAGIAARIAQADSATHAGVTAAVQPMRSGLRPNDMNDIYPVATLAAIVTVLVLLIACANVSNLLLSRALGRRREIAIRLSVGAARARVVRQLLVESGVVALIATGVATLLTIWVTDLIASVIPAPIDLAIDGRVLAFAGIAALFTTVLFGLVPALHATRADVSAALKDGTTGDRRKSRLQSGFAIAQVALSLVLLCTAGLFLSSLYEATRRDVGFDASRRVLAMSFDMGMQGYTPQKAAIFLNDLSARARAIPGVELVSVTDPVPLGERIIAGTPSFEVKQPDGSNKLVERREQETFLNTVGPAYFAALDLPITRGREFTERDVVGSPPVAVVSEKFARDAFGGADPIGQRLSMNGERGPVLTVIGVAKNAMASLGQDEQKGAVYVAQRQNPSALELTLLVRARGDAAAIAQPLRDVFRSLDASMPVVGVQTLAQYKWDRLSESRLGSRILAIVGSLALLLASIGVYAVVAFSVTQRTREIGVRVALGAVQRQVVGMFIREGMRLTAYGVGIGLVLSLALAKLLSAIFIGISMRDVVAFGGVSVVLALVTLCACWLPARRAARVDAMQALRAD